MDKDITNEGASWIIFSMTQIAKEKVHYGFFCSQCNYRIFDITDESEIPETCPRCGADMSIN
jgi:rubrerythrin